VYFDFETGWVQRVKRDFTFRVLHSWRTSSCEARCVAAPGRSAMSPDTGERALRLSDRMADPRLLAADAARTCAKSSPALLRT